MRIEENHCFENRGAIDRKKMVILARQEIDIDPRGTTDLRGLQKIQYKATDL